MVKFYHPWIARKNFKAFRRMLELYFSTFDEWLQFHARRIAYDKAKRHETINVEVDPDEFAEFCKVRGCAPDLEALDCFAFERAIKNNSNKDHPLVAPPAIASGVSELPDHCPPCT